MSTSMLSLYYDTMWTRETFLNGVLLSGSSFSTLNRSSKIFLSSIVSKAIGIYILLFYFYKLKHPRQI